jgi:leader peptidase (prepilin peptidase)/N-methyltransferase
VLGLYIVLIGLAMASFLCSLAYRVPRGISIFTPPSFCASCSRRLKPWELVPVLSFILFRGRCRTCGSRIPVRYFAVELLTPLLYYGLYRIHGLTPLFFTRVYILSLLLYLSLVDLDSGSISFADIAATYAGGLAAVLLSMRGLTGYSVLESLYGFLLCAGLLGLSLLLIAVVKKRRALGFGDLLLLPGTAFYLGVYGVIRVLLFSSLMGLLVGAVLLLMGKIHREYKLPLIPFVTAGMCVEFLLFSGNIIL